MNEGSIRNPSEQTKISLEVFIHHIFVLMCSSLEEVLSYISNQLSPPSALFEAIQLNVAAAAYKQTACPIIRAKHAQHRYHDIATFG